MGAFIGDAAGAYLEFKSVGQEYEVNRALMLEGGGSMNTGKGQVTDDSEMALGLF